MKNILVLGLAGLALISCAPAQTLQQGERDRAMSHLHATRKLFLDSLAGVTPQQWNWKPAPDVWSIAEVAEHIAISEQNIFQYMRKVVKDPAPDAAAMAKASKANDEKVIALLVDRSQKGKAPEMLQPKHKFANAAEVIAQFKEDRDATIEYVQTTQDALRAHATPHPVFQMLDAYQWILLISAHTERHTAQLNEVKTKPGFPK